MLIFLITKIKRVDLEIVLKHTIEKNNKNYYSNEFFNESRFNFFCITQIGTIKILSSNSELSKYINSNKKNYNKNISKEKAYQMISFMLLTNRKI